MVCSRTPLLFPFSHRVASSPQWCLPLLLFIICFPLLLRHSVLIISANRAHCLAMRPSTSRRSFRISRCRHRATPLSRRLPRSDLSKLLHKEELRSQLPDSRLDPLRLGLNLTQAAASRSTTRIIILFTTSPLIPSSSCFAPRRPAPNSKSGEECREVFDSRSFLFAILIVTLFLLSFE